MSSVEDVDWDLYFDDDDEDDWEDDGVPRSLTPQQVFASAGMANRFDGRLVSSVIAAVKNEDSGFRNEKLPLLSRTCKFTTMRAVYLCYRDCGPGWFTNIHNFVSSDVIKMAYLHHVPNIRQQSRQYTSDDWDLGYGHRFSGEVAIDEVMLAVQPAVRLAIKNLPARMRNKSRKTPRKPPKDIVNLLCSMLKAKPPKNNSGWFKVVSPSQPPSKQKAYITMKKETKAKMNASLAKTVSNLRELMWKEGVSFLGSGDWKPVRLPFHPAKRGFYILQKHMNTIAFPGDLSWSVDVYRIVEEFAENSPWFASWKENGVSFDHKRSRRIFINYASFLLSCNYFQGRWLETLGIFTKRLSEHLAGTVAEMLWFIMCEYHKAKGTYHKAQNWLKQPLIPLLTKLLDLFVTTVGWTAPNSGSPLIKRRSRQAGIDATMTNATRQSHAAGEFSEGSRAGSAQAMAGPSTRPSPRQTRKRSKKKVGQDTSELSETAPSSSEAATSRVLAHSSILNSAYLHQQSKKKRKKGKKGKKNTRAPDLLPQSAIIDVAHSSSLPSTSDIPSLDPTPTTSSTLLAPIPSLEQDGSPNLSPRTDANFPRLLWTSPLLQSSFSFRFESSMSLSSLSSLDSMQSLKEAIEAVDSAKGFNVFPVFVDRNS